MGVAKLLIGIALGCFLGRKEIKKLMDNNKK